MILLICSDFTKFCHKHRKETLDGPSKATKFSKWFSSSCRTCSLLQFFFSCLVFAIFYWCFDFFFCSFPLTSIILANFQNSTAFARNNGVNKGQNNCCKEAIWVLCSSFHNILSLSLYIKHLCSGLRQGGLCLICNL